jgi:U3 small nucleolar RNA-associated protein 14
MLSEEIKNKRVAKIKSKLYHKIKRKNKEREEKLLLEQLEQIDPETAQKVKMKTEEKRVDERVRSRHSTKNKYAKNLIRFAGLQSQATKDGLGELIRTRDEIKQKPILETAHEEQMSESESQSVSGSDSESDPEKLEQAEAQNPDEPQEIKIDFSEETKGKPKKTNAEKEEETGLFALKFMKDAETRDEEKLKQYKDLVKQEIMDEINEDDEEELQQVDKPTEGRVKSQPEKEKNYSLNKLQEKMYDSYFSILNEIAKQ